jgi:hypothetical protein
MKYPSLARALAALVLTLAGSQAFAQKAMYDYQLTVVDSISSRTMIDVLVTTDALVDQFGAQAIDVAPMPGASMGEMNVTGLDPLAGNLLYSVADGAKSWADASGFGMTYQINFGLRILNGSVFFTPDNIKEQTASGSVFSLHRVVNGVATGPDLTLAAAAPTAAVPEPEAFAMGLAGLAVVGGLARRRRLAA